MCLCFVEMLLGEFEASPRCFLVDLRHRLTRAGFQGHKACSQALWAIQEEAEVKKGGHASAGVPVDNPEDDEVRP